MVQSMWKNWVNCLLLALILAFSGAVAVAREGVEQELALELENLGFEKSQIEAILAASDIRFMHIQVLHAQENYMWLVASGFKNPQKLVVKRPQILGLSLEQNLQVKFDWIKGLGVKSPATVIEKNPDFIGNSLETLQNKVSWLQSIGVPNVARVIEECDKFFSFGIEDHLKPTYNWLLLVGVAQPALVIHRHPEILSVNLDKLKARFQWMQRIGIRDVSGLLNRQPRVFSNGLEKMKRNYQWLQTMLFENPARMLERLPTILNRSVELSLKPNLLILAQDWGVSLSEIEDEPILLTAQYQRVLVLSQFLKSLELDLRTAFTKPQRSFLIKNVSAADIQFHLANRGYYSADFNTRLVTIEVLLANKQNWIRKKPADPCSVGLEAAASDADTDADAGAGNAARVIKP